MNAPWAPFQAPAVAPDPEAEKEQKDRFAEALLRTPTDPFRAALTVFGNDTATALRISNLWPYDLYVLQRQAELLEQFGPDEYLPTKQQVARRIYEVGENAADNKDKLAAFKLYAELRGFVPKGEGVTNNLTVNNNRVMIMKDFGTDEQWESAAVGQQTKLIEHSRD